MKIVFRSVFAITLIFLVFVLHMTFIGIETNKFNNQIQDKVKNINEDLQVELKKIKIILNPLNLKLNIKNFGSEFKLDNKII